MSARGLKVKTEGGRWMRIENFSSRFYGEQMESGIVAGGEKKIAK